MSIKSFANKGAEEVFMHRTISEDRVGLSQTHELDP